MGYEILIPYYEQIGEGEYNREETKTMKKRVGDPYEDVSLDKCAGVIMAQLARRDIWVITKGIEVYEVSKKKINFNNSKGSITLKNKKYRMDGSAEIISQEIVEAQPIQQTAMV